MTDLDVEEASPPPVDPVPPRRAGRGRRRILIVLAVVVAVGLVAAGALAFYVRGQIDPGSPGAEVQVTIPQGATTAGIAGILHTDGVIGSTTVFKEYVRFKGIAPFQAGNYTLHRHESYSQVITVLRKGPKVTVDRITIPEGFTLEQIAARVGTLPGRSAAKFMQVANGGQVRSRFEPAGTTNLEGLLFPDTYFVTATDDEQAILQRMVDAFDQQATDLGIDAAATRLGRTPYELVIIASMVEREAKVDSDRGKIASVIYNRLNQHIKLGIDATLLYALHGDAVELGKRPNQPSPYNTRIIPGLPPTPIASPGRPSLQAAFTPDQTNFIYYVLTSKDGHHTFTASAAEFDRLVAQARKNGLL